MEPEPKFIPGSQLNEMFYQQVVRPILTTCFPAVAHSAALIGYGSDVLGFDTPISTDHNWGPRLQLFLSPADHEKFKTEIHTCLCQKLPPTFQGFSVNFSPPALNDGVQWMQTIEAGPVNHLIEIYTVRSFFEHYLGINPGQEIESLDWLTFPEQTLLEVTAGRVYFDGLGELEPVRARFAYYPTDIWLYRLASQWGRIAQEEAFMGRCGDLGDELGSRIIAARLVRDLMRLGFLLEKQYAPYSKWLGTAFTQLNCGPELTPVFNRILDGSAWMQRQEHLGEAYVILAKLHNSLGITPFVDPQISDYFGRPYRVLFADRFVEAIKDSLTDEKVKDIKSDIGGIDQFADCVDLTDNLRLTKKLRIIYEEVT
jgi:hypothetical protein